MFQLLIKKGKNRDVFGLVFKLSLSSGQLFSAYLYLRDIIIALNINLQKYDTIKECNLYDCFLVSTYSDT